MNKKQKFIELVDMLLDGASIDEEYKDALDYFEMLKTEKENNKPAFTENGAKVLKYIQENVDVFNNMFKAKDIGEGTMMSSRGASGAMRKLVTDGYLEKIGADPVIYALTEKGKTVDIEAALKYYDIMIISKKIKENKK